MLLLVLLIGFSPIEDFNTQMATFVATMLIIGALWANKFGKTLLSALIVVLVAEAAVIGILLSSLSTPLTPIVFQEYDYLVGVDLLALLLLPPRNLFLLATLNSAFIAGHLLYGPQMQAMGDLLQSDPFQILLLPIGLQFLVAAVGYLWVSTVSKASQRADRAEMVTALERIMGQQNAVAEQEKQELEESIQYLIQVHTNAINGQVFTRISYPPAKTLWPLVGMINSLWARLQHAQQTEKELQQMRKAIDACTQLVEQASQSPRQPLLLVRTGTECDQLLLSLKKLQETWQKAKSTKVVYSSAVLR